MASKTLASCLLVAATACGGAIAERPAPTDAARAYPGRCRLVGIEYAEVPREADTEPEPGAVLLVASYRPGADPADAFAVRFRVEQRSAETLRAHLEKHADLACDPERGDAPDSVDLPPLDEDTPEP